VFRLGLSGSFDLDDAACGEALDRVQYVFWSPRMKGLTVALRAALARTGKLVEDSILDLLMIRYNAAHPGAEQDISPHLARRRLAMIAYTATAWRRLLRAPRGWKGKVATAEDCYRFCLTGPHIDVAPTGPRDVMELRENLAALEKGSLSPEEMPFMREFGHAVHG
jgi:hypothetical protein